MKKVVNIQDYQNKETDSNYKKFMIPGKSEAIDITKEINMKLYAEELERKDKEKTEKEKKKEARRLQQEEWRMQEEARDREMREYEAFIRGRHEEYKMIQQGYKAEGAGSYFKGAIAFAILIPFLAGYLQLLILNGR